MSDGEKVDVWCGDGMLTSCVCKDDSYSTFESEDGLSYREDGESYSSLVLSFLLLLERLTERWSGMMLIGGSVAGRWLPRRRCIGMRMDGPIMRIVSGLMVVRGRKC